MYQNAIDVEDITYDQHNDKEQGSHRNDTDGQKFIVLHDIFLQIKTNQIDRHTHAQGHYTDMYGSFRTVTFFFFIISGQRHQE